MFYIWHTLLVAAFIAIAYGLGYRFGRIKLYDRLLNGKKVKSNLVNAQSDKETSHKDWLEGYHKWKKTQNRN